MGVSLVVLVCVFPPWCGYACFSPWYVCYPRGVRVSPRGMCVFPVVGVRGFPPWYVCFPRGGGTGVSPVVCAFSPWWGYGGFPRPIKLKYKRKE